MPTTYRRTDTTSDLGGGQDFNKAILLPGSDASGPQTVSLGNGETRTSYGFTAPGVPGSTGITGTYTVEMNVASGNSNVALAVRLHRVNSAGTVQSSSALSAEQTATAGVKTFTFTNQALGTWASGNRLRVDYQYRNTAHGGQSFDAAHGGVNNEVIAPWNTITATVVQPNFRIRDTDSVALNSTTFSHALNANASIPLDQKFRIRFEIEETAGATYSGDYYLQVSKNSGAWGQAATYWTTSPHYADADPTTNILSGSGRTFTTGRGVEAGASGSVTGAPTLNNQHTEFEWTIVLSSGTHTAGDTFDFRVGQGTSLGFSSYTNVPRITALAAAGTTETVTHTTDLVLQATETLDHTTDLVLQATETLGHTTDLNLSLVSYAIALPDGVVTNNGPWDDPDGVYSGAGLWQALDDGVTNTDDNTSKLRSIVNPAFTNYFEVSLTDITDPGVATGHIMRIRGRCAVTSVVHDVEFHLYEGTTLRATGTGTWNSLTWTTLSYTLTESEANAITDYTDLRIRFAADQISGTSARAQVTGVELEVSYVADTLRTHTTDLLIDSVGGAAAALEQSNVVGDIDLPSSGLNFSFPATPTASNELYFLVVARRNTSDGAFNTGAMLPSGVSWVSGSPLESSVDAFGTTLIGWAKSDLPSNGSTNLWSFTGVTQHKHQVFGFEVSGAEGPRAAVSDNFHSSDSSDTATVTGVGSQNGDLALFGVTARGSEYVSSWSGEFVTAETFDGTGSAGHRLQSAVASDEIESDSTVTPTATLVGVSDWAAALLVVAGGGAQAGAERVHTTDLLLSYDYNEITISGTDFYLDGVILNQGSEAEGLLMNSRMVQATVDFSDESEVSNWNAEANTAAFIAMLDDYKAKGVNSLMINVQGGNFASASPAPAPPGGYWGNTYDAGGWNANGTLRPDHATRLKNVLNACVQNGITPMVGLTYFRQDWILTNETAVLNMLDNAMEFLAPWKNQIIVEVVNESENTNVSHAILQEDRNHELVDVLVANGFIASASHHSGVVPTTVQQGDGQLVMLHANGETLAGITTMVNSARSTFPSLPIIINEDGHPARTASEAVDRVNAAVAAGSGWGFHEPNGYQYWDGTNMTTMDWSISSTIQIDVFDEIEALTTPTAFLTHTTDLVTQATEVSTHTTDLVIQATETRTHTTDLILRSTESRTHTTDLIVQATESLTHTTDLVAQATETLTHTTDLVLSATEALVHTTDLVLRATENLAHTTDLVRSAAGALGHLTDLILQATQTVTHTTDLLAVAPFEVAFDSITDPLDDTNHSLDVRARKANVGDAGSLHVQLLSAGTVVDEFDIVLTDSFVTTNHPIDEAVVATFDYSDLSVRAWGVPDSGEVLTVEVAMVRLNTPEPPVETFTKTHTTDLILGTTGTETHTTDLVLRATEAQSHSTDLVLLATELESHTTDLILLSVLTAVHTTDLVLQATETLTHSSDVVLSSTGALTHTTDLVLRATVERSHTTDLRVAAQGALLHSTDLVLFGTATVAHSTDLAIATRTSVDHTTDLIVQTTVAAEHTTDLIVSTTETQAHTTDLVLRATETLVHTTDLIIPESGTVAHTSDLVIRATVETSHTTDLVISQAGSATHTTDLLLQIRPPSWITATPISATRIDVEWESVPDADAYDLERDSVVIAEKYVGTSYQDEGLDPSTEYTYRVRSARML